jgi:hypothetical protein
MHVYCFNLYGSEWLLFNANSAIFQLYHGAHMYTSIHIKWKTKNTTLFPNSIEISLREAKFNTSNTQLHDNLLSSAMFQLYHDENKLDDNFRFVANTSVIVFGLTRSGLEPTIYRTRGEHSKHYTTDAVLNGRCLTYLLTYLVLAMPHGT